MFYTTVLFDLDGTLIESGRGIITIARAVLGEIGWPDQPDAAMIKMVGPPLENCYSDILKVPPELLPAALEKHRALSKTMGMDLMSLYPGISELLAALRKAGAELGVVTSRATPTAGNLVEHFGIVPYFDIVRGGTPGGNAEKLSILRGALNDLNAERGTTVMVGDRYFDLLAAKEAGVDSVGVTYGYGTAEEIAACGPTHTADSVARLGELLLNGTGKNDKNDKPNEPFERKE